MSACVTRARLHERAPTFSAVACGTGFWPTTATGAVSQRPTHGACSTRTPSPSSAGSVFSSSCDPASSQAIESQTRTVIAGRRRLALLDDVEVVIEGGHFVDLGHRHLQLGRERDQMRGGQAAVAILNPVQVLDEQIAPARRIAEQREHVLPRLRIDAASLGRAADARALAFGGASTAEPDSEDGVRSLIGTRMCPKVHAIIALRVAFGSGHYAR